MPSLVAALRRAAAEWPSKELLSFEGLSLSYGAALARAEYVAARLRAAGIPPGSRISPGDRVALFLHNSPSFVEAYLGALLAGAVVVPLNTRYRHDELQHVLRDATPKILVTDPPGRETLQACGLSGLSGVYGCREVLVDVPGREDDAAWNELGGASAKALPEPGPDTSALLLYTSGTTGRSKGALLTHGNLLDGARAVVAAWEWTQADRLYLALPLFHMHGLGVGLHGTLVAGASLTLERAFDAASTREALAEGTHTLFFGVPTMHTRLVTAGPGPRGLRLVVSGSAPLSPPAFAAMEAFFGMPPLERYGMTETVMLLGNPLRGERKPGSVGLPFPGVTLRIVDLLTREPVGEGVAGELEVAGPSVFHGYWRNADATREAFTADGFFRTGDIGFRDASGHVSLTGRARELIITGGFNVFPREVEEVLERHPGILEAAVYGLSDADLGERVAAAIVRSDGELSEREIRDHCGRHLAGFKTPRAIVFVDALPRNALGKIQKHLLRTA